MSLFQTIAAWWEKEKRAQVAGQLRFEVEEQPERLVLIRRLEPIFVRYAPPAIFAGFFLSWFASHRFAMPWIVVGAILSTLIVALAMPKIWQMWGSDVWVIDARQSRIEHDGELVGSFAQMQCVQVTEESDHGDDSYRYVLTIKKRSGKPLVLTQIGDSPEMLQLAHLIGKYAQLPVETNFRSNCTHHANTK
ncbi:MAG TPA: hypothetical protein VF627_01780 [Abditibacterium sp.]|jgi:hypothetical protein